MFRIAGQPPFDSAMMAAAELGKEIVMGVSHSLAIAVPMAVPVSLEG